MPLWRGKIDLYCYCSHYQQANTTNLCVAWFLVSPPLVLQTLPHVGHTWPAWTFTVAASDLLEVAGLEFLLLYLNKSAWGRCCRCSLALRSIFWTIVTGLPSLSSLSEFSLSSLSLSPSLSSSSSPSLSTHGSSSSLSSIPANKPLLKLLASSCILRGSCTEQMGQIALFGIEYPWSLQSEDLPRQTLWKVWLQLRRFTGRFTWSSSALWCEHNGNHPLLTEGICCPVKASGEDCFSNWVIWHLSSSVYIVCFELNNTMYIAICSESCPFAVHMSEFLSIYLCSCL